MGKDKIQLANELLSLTKEIEAHLEKSDVAFAKDNEPKRMQLAQEIFSSDVLESDSEEIHKILSEVLEVNSRLQKFAKSARDEVVHMSNQIKKAKKGASIYQEHR